jgi:hypothetical protein
LSLKSEARRFLEKNPPVEQLYELALVAFKGSHRMWGLVDFLKTSAPLFLIKTCGINTLSARSISLDSTF